jgi:hypothetical protein
MMVRWPATRFEVTIGPGGNPQRGTIHSLRRHEKSKDIKSVATLFK